MSINTSETSSFAGIRIAAEQRKQIMDEKLNKFCKNYDIRIENDHRLCTAPRYQFFSVPEDASLIHPECAVRHEKMYTISIPESRLKTLVDMEERISRYTSNGGYDLLTTLLAKEREEKAIREQNEGIAHAYEQYSMLLNLAGYEQEF